LGVVEDLTPRELETQDKNAAWFHCASGLTRTEDNKIDGAVMVFHDIDQLKRSLQEVQQARDFSQAIVETAPEPLVILDDAMRLMIGTGSSTIHFT